MPAIDLVTANEFTFTPSAFIAAYIEQEEKTTVTDTSSNSGSLEVEPKDVDNIKLDNPERYQISNAKFKDTSTSSITSGSFVLSNPFLFGNVSKLPNLNYRALVPPHPDPLTVAGNTFGSTFNSSTPSNLSPYSLEVFNGYEVTHTAPKTEVGILNSTGQVTAAGTLVDLIGQITTDTRSTTKTTTTSNAVANTVVLVLSYGQFRAKCVDAQATVTSIYNAVNVYLASL